MPENTRTASGPLPGSPEVVDTLQGNSSIPGKIKLSVEDEKRQLQEEYQRLQEEARQKEAVLRELEDESIKTLNSAFITLRRFHEIIEADDFIEDSRRRIEHARPEDRTRVILDVLRSTTSLFVIIRTGRVGR